MKLELVRTYYPEGTNGTFFLKGTALCHAIELAWHINKNSISCIPEGSYELQKRYSAKFGWHLILMHVPGRELVLIHPANDAEKELKGCIAPVSVLTAEGKGIQSRIAFKKLTAVVFAAIEKKEKIFLTIKSGK